MITTNEEFNVKLSTIEIQLLISIVEKNAAKANESEKTGAYVLYLNGLRDKLKRAEMRIDPPEAWG